MGKLHIISTRLTDNSINSRNNPSRKSKADSVLMRRRFQSLMEMEKSPISCWRPDTTLTFVNQPYCDLLGKPEEEILGRKWVEMMPEEIRQKAKSIYADLSKNPSSHRFEYNIRRKNGKVCHMEWTEHPIRDQKGKLIEFMSIGKDITELRKDKENLAESENRYRQLANSMDEGLIIQNEKGVVTYVNNSFLKITSSQERDLLNVSAKNIRNLDKSLVDMLVEQKKFSRKSRCDFRELSLRKNDKKPSYIHVSTIPLVDERGAFKGGFIIVSNISHQKKIEERLRKINDCLLHLGSDADKNIQSLTRLFGELMDSDSAFYKRLEDDTLSIKGQWQMPNGYIQKDKAEGHICQDVILSGSDNPFILRNLPETDYFFSDHDVARYGLKTYIGQAVRMRESFMGSLCAVFSHDFVPTRDDLRVMGIVAAAISSEEERIADQAVIETKMNLQKLISVISARFVGKFDFDKAASESLADLGRIIKAQKGYLFLIADKNFIINTHSWQERKKSFFAKSHKKIAIEKLPWWFKKLKEKKILNINNSSKLFKSALIEWSLFSSSAPQSILAIPILSAHKMIGFIALENVEFIESWNSNDYLSLKVVAEIFGNALEIMKTEEDLVQALEKSRNAKKEWEITVDSLPQIICLLSKKGKIVRINKTVESWKLGSVRLSRGIDLHELLHADCRDGRCALKRDLRSIGKKSEGGQPIEIVHQSSYLKKTICIKIHPLTGKQGERGYAAIAIIYDITEKIKANQKNLEMFKYLGRINRKISILLDMNKGRVDRNKKEAYKYITQSSLHIADATISLLYQYEEKSKNYVLLESHGSFSDRTKKNLSTLSQDKYSFLEKIGRNKARIQGFSHESSFKLFNKKLSLRKDVDTFLSIPLTYQGEIKGLLVLGFEKKNALSTQELEFYDLFSLQASIILMNAQQIRVDNFLEI